VYGKTKLQKYQASNVPLFYFKFLDNFIFFNKKKITQVQGGPIHKRIWIRELRENFSAFSVKIIDFSPISEPMSQNFAKNG
jgi:hypothetical protein